MELRAPSIELGIPSAGLPHAIDGFPKAIDRSPKPIDGIPSPAALTLKAIDRFQRPIDGTSRAIPWLSESHLQGFELQTSHSESHRSLSALGRWRSELHLIP